MRRSTGQQPGKKRALLVPVRNRLSTSRCVPPLFQIGFRLFVLLEKYKGDVSSMPWGVRGKPVSWANSSVGVPSCPGPPCRPNVRPDPTRPWYVRVLDSASKLFIFRGYSYLQLMLVLINNSRSLGFSIALLEWCIQNAPFQRASYYSIRCCWRFQEILKDKQMYDKTYVMS